MCSWEFYSAIQPKFYSNGLYIELIPPGEEMLIFLQVLGPYSLDLRPGDALLHRTPSLDLVM